MAGILAHVFPNTFPNKSVVLSFWKSSAVRTQLTVAGTALVFHQFPFSFAIAKPCHTTKLKINNLFPL
jgi:hypothetical protein